MTTTIKSTALDFNSIKNNLKTFLAAQNEFADYDFEASGLSNILDVLAYNTHYNALTANFALNEGFLSTAQLRSSVVSVAQNVGYIPGSKTASTAIVNLTLDLSSLVGRPSIVYLDSGTSFKSTVDDTVYTFYVRENLSATDDGSGIYTFENNNGETNITLYEGLERTKTFIAGSETDELVYVIPDRDLDISTVIVRVYSSPSSSEFNTYSNIKTATTISDSSRYYILKESPNGYYDLLFGRNDVFGIQPTAGNKIEVNYLRVNGAAADNARLFTPNAAVTVSGQNFNLSVTTVSASSGGGEKESIDSIKRNAPYQYAAQNRMVTADDYAALILREYSEYINDVIAWGGQDNPEPRFGAIYVSIVYKTGVSDVRKTLVQEGIRELVRQLAVASFDVVFENSIITFIEAEVFFQFNRSATQITVGTAQSNVRTAIANYFAENTGTFGDVFRRSNLLTQIDNVADYVLSSRANIKVQQRITPSLGRSTDYNLKFPNPLAVADDVNYIVTSSQFVFNSRNCIIRNALNSTKLQIVGVTESSVEVDNIGSFNPTAGTINLTAFAPTAITSGASFIKISAVPGNQSLISSTLNNVIQYDDEVSFASAVISTTI